MLHFVYLTTNTVNGHRYIGQHTTNDMDDGYLGSGKLLIKAIEKYGKENFKREILEYCNSPEELNEAEIRWIKSENPYYNLGLGGEGNPSEFWTEERRKTMSQKYSNGNHPACGTKRSEETKRRISKSRLGIPPWHKGSNLSEDHKKRIAKALKGNKNAEGMNPWNKGAKLPPHSEEWKENISKGLEGHFVSSQTKKKIGEAQKGKHWYNNGVIMKKAFTCPDGFVKGML